ncbi:MAG: hypothetical protein NT139_01945 [Candidatus Woesearchaeota archaeon]|nr:hypothetical protein [Candidatus Woesearchaeota archaeon]
MKKRFNKSIIILYILIILIIAFDAFYYIKFINNEKWQCSQIMCKKVKTVQEWTDENCVNDKGTTMCNVVLNNEKQLVPLQSINQQNLQQLLNQQCLQGYCIQEVKVRPVNYTIDTTSQK